jgi:alpha-glucosidase
MNPVRAAGLLESHARGIVLDCGGGMRCRISVLAPDLVRVTFLRAAGLAQKRSWMVLEPGAADAPWAGRDRMDESGWPAAAFAVVQAADAITLRTAALSLHVTLDSLALRWALPDGRVFARDRAKHAYLFGARQPTLRHCLARDPRDRYFGLGDKSGALDLHGRRLRSWMTDALGTDPERGDPFYKHWPFLIAKDGETGTAYGVFYDNAGTAVFDLGAEHDNYYDLYRSYAAESGDLDYYMFVGPGLRDVTRKFVALTGRTALPPRWTLGFAQTTMALADAPDAQARIEEFVARAAAERIPISAFHFGSGYTSIGPKRYVFNWNRQKFPDPVGLIRRFHAAGIKVVANLKPCLLDDHPRYAEARDSGAFVRKGETGGPVISQFWDGEGAHLDFTSDAAIAWWQDGLQAAVLDTGIDAAWNDNNEYGMGDEDGTCDGFGAPIPLDLARPLQPLLMTRASIEQQMRSRPGERPFTVTRAGCPGVQRYAQSWSGDNTTSWHCLKWNLRTGLTMSMSGMYNIGHDVGGFWGPLPDAELLIRWTQAGLVHPRFIMNSWKPDGEYNSPWLHPSATPAIRDAIRLRYRLMPYLYSLMHAAVAEGAPVLMPTCVAFEDDVSTCADCDELMLGPGLLAAPVVAPGERARRVYLPAGPELWFDFYSGERLAAGSVAVLAAPLDRLPLAVAAGSIIPMTGEADDFSRLHDEPSRCLRLFPGDGTGASRFVLAEDDGISAAATLTRLTLDLAWTPQEISLTVTSAGDYTLPYDHMAVILPAAELRPCRIVSDAGAPALRLSADGAHAAAARPAGA